MRIIAGQFRAMPLVAAAGETTRPITDRAKQSLFDALQDCFAADGGGTVLDCFAGTGSMGLECLSRGAAHAIFIESNRAALRGLKQNIAFLGVADRAIILPIDAYSIAEQHSALTTHHASPLTIAFVDPPYAHTATGHERHQVDGLLRMLAAHHMVDGGIISFRHPSHISLDPTALHVKIIREFRYGDMAITWLTKDVAP